MPYITKNGIKFWVTPQQDKSITGYHDSVAGVPLPDYILHGKDKDSKYDKNSTPEQIKDFRNRQKDNYQGRVMRAEKDTLNNNRLNYVASVNRLNDTIYLLKRKSLIQTRKKQKLEYLDKIKMYDKKLEEYYN